MSGRARYGFDATGFSRLISGLMTDRITILGIFVADATFRAERTPVMGETVIADSFALSPGGKGSNQAIAAAKLGANVSFLSKLGKDTFADMAFQIWQDAGVDPHVSQVASSYTGAANIFVDNTTGENAIVVCPGAAQTISVADIEADAKVIESSALFMTQLEQPVPAARRALEIARAAGVRTILNPAPATTLPDGMLALCDYVTPNEHEAEMLTGMPVRSIDDARRAAQAFLDAGVGTAVITLGERGAVVCSDGVSEHVPAFDFGTVVETTGAGDAFSGAFATALVRGDNLVDAVRFGCAAASLSVSRPGAALSMPTLSEVEAFLGSRAGP